MTAQGIFYVKSCVCFLASDSPDLPEKATSNQCYHWKKILDGTTMNIQSEVYSTLQRRTGTVQNKGNWQLYRIEFTYITT